MAYINLSRFASLTGDIGNYTYNAARTAAKDVEADAKTKQAFADVKLPLGLPDGTYELDMQARGYVYGTMKVTKATTPHDILRAVAEYFIGHSDTYMDELAVNTKKKLITASFGT